MSLPRILELDGLIEDAVFRKKIKKNRTYWMLGAGALGRPRGMEWGGRREEG